MVELVDEADFRATDGGALVVRQIVARAAADKDFATIWMFEQACQVKERRLACTRRRYECDDLAGSQLEIGAFQNRKRRFSLAIMTFDICKLQYGFTRCHEVMGSYS
ncbi:hypothetical protein D3C87_1736680 [compost metagenome]